MAVSAVLNGARTSSRISTQTQERILEAAKQLNYRPNGAARALAARRMNTIGVAMVVDGGELNTYFLEVFNGVLEGAAARNQNTTVFALHDWANDATTRLPRFCDGRIDGMILMAPLLKTEHDRPLPDDTPFVTIHSNVPLSGVVNLETDEENGAYQLVRELIRRGHSRLLYVTGDRGQRGAERRIRGFQRALADGGITFHEELLVNAAYNTYAGRTAIREWLERNGRRNLPDAIFCGNDSSAVGVLEALSEAGISVPDDVSVAGFDDSLAARTTSPQLTTVRQPLREMGRRAVEALLRKIHGDHEHTMADAQPSIVFPTEVVFRASVRDRRGGA